MGNPAASELPKAPVTTDRGFIEECLKVHNELRAKHGSPDLVLNDELSEIAQNWANHCAKLGKMQHNDDNEEYGENIYWATGGLLTPRACVEKWYSEIKDYNFNSNSDSMQSGTGHFTQVVWKETTEMGVAKAESDRGTYVVAIYNPGGNMTGEFRQNVCPC